MGCLEEGKAWEILDWEILNVHNHGKADWEILNVHNHGKAYYGFGT